MLGAMRRRKASQQWDPNQDRTQDKEQMHQELQRVRQALDDDSLKQMLARELEREKEREREREKERELREQREQELAARAKEMRELERAKLMARSKSKKSLSGKDKDASEGEDSGGDAGGVDEWYGLARRDRREKEKEKEKDGATKERNKENRQQQQQTREEKESSKQEEEKGQKCTRSHFFKRGRDALAFFRSSHHILCLLIFCIFTHVVTACFLPSCHRFSAFNFFGGHNHKAAEVESEPAVPVASTLYEGTTMRFLGRDHQLRNIDFSGKPQLPKISSAPSAPATSSKRAAPADKGQSEGSKDNKPDKPRHAPSAAEPPPKAHLKASSSLAQLPSNSKPAAPGKPAASRAKLGERGGLQQPGPQSFERAPMRGSRSLDALGRPEAFERTSPSRLGPYAARRLQMAVEAHLEDSIDEGYDSTAFDGYDTAELDGDDDVGENANANANANALSASMAEASGARGRTSPAKPAAAAAADANEALRMSIPSSPLRPMGREAVVSPTREVALRAVREELMKLTAPQLTMEDLFAGLGENTRKALQDCGN